jgi:thiamine biosynthesis lipoprotein ApbE
MQEFRSMGCDVALPHGLPAEEIRALFDARDARFSRFIPESELSRANRTPLGIALVSDDFASMLSLSLDAARATDGRVTPTVGRAVTAAR